MPKWYPPEQRQRATPMVVDRLEDYGGSPWAAAPALGPKLGVGPESFGKWVCRTAVTVDHHAAQGASGIGMTGRSMNPNALCAWPSRSMAWRHQFNTRPSGPNLASADFGILHPRSRGK